MPKRLDELKNDPTVFSKLGAEGKPESEVAVDAVRLAFETLTGQNTDPKVREPNDTDSVTEEEPKKEEEKSQETPAKQ